jgi:hypothetical protein
LSGKKGATISEMRTQSQVGEGGRGEREEREGGEGGREGGEGGRRGKTARLDVCSLLFFFYLILGACPGAVGRRERGGRSAGDGACGYSDG